MYQSLTTVADQIRKQLDACLNALDLHQDMPDEGEDLGTALAKAHELCETILDKAAKETTEPEVKEEPQLDTEDSDV